jgi:GxxExxY protein
MSGRSPLSTKESASAEGSNWTCWVNDCVVVELKAVERLHPIYLAQVITYLKISGFPAGLLMNFNSTTLRAGLRRLDHPDRYAKKLL